MSMYVREGLMAAMGPAVAVLLERYGLPLARMEMKFVEGCLYMRPVAVGEGAKPSSPPPAPIMKLIARLHPEMRRRNRAARKAWEEKRWRGEVDRWFDVERPQIVAANLEFQALSPGAVEIRVTGFNGFYGDDLCFRLTCSDAGEIGIQVGSSWHTDVGGVGSGPNTDLHGDVLVEKRSAGARAPLRVFSGLSLPFSKGSGRS